MDSGTPTKGAATSDEVCRWCGLYRSKHTDEQWSAGQFFLARLGRDFAYKGPDR